MILFIVAIFEFFLPTLENNLIERKREMIRELTHTAISSMDYFHQEELAGRLSTEQAQKLASAAIRQLRYGIDKKDYFWIQNLDPIFLMHPYRPDLEGTHADEFSDTDGKPLLDSFVREGVKPNGGFVDYYWQWKDDPSRVAPKVSYVRLYEPWQWIVGTGVYIEDVRAEMNTLRWRIVKVSLLILAVIGLMSLLMVWQSLSADRQRQEAENLLRASEAQYREIAARIPGVVFQYAMNSNKKNAVPFISERTEEFIGIRAHEIVADPKLFFQAIHEDERAGVVDSLRDAAQRMDNWNREFRLVARNGDVRWVRASAAPTKIPEKGILWNGLLLDVSSLKQSEQERERLITLVENSTEFVG
ncbi:MAG TPA: cache domain-containing protein, partial [bacterium]|nr:cache domain-containing protein [bacterium]